MTIEQILIAILVCAIVTQTFAYHFVTQKLLNKLMSRNYYEYASTKKIMKEKKKEPIKIQVSEQGQNEMGVLDELNQMIV